MDRAFFTKKVGMNSPALSNIFAFILLEMIAICVCMYTDWNRRLYSHSQNLHV